MVKKIGPEYQYWEGGDKNSNVWNDKTIIPMPIEIGPEFNRFQV